MFSRAIIAALVMLAAVRPAPSAGLKLGVSASYLAARDQLFKEIYGSGGMLPAASLAYGFKRFEIRAEAGFFAATGAMTGSGEELHFRMIPLLFGARYEILRRGLRPYVGLGFGSILYDEDYPERFEDVSGSCALAYIEAGGNWLMRKGLYVDFNARWSTSKARSFNEESIDLGGLKAGLGVGYAF
jgi:hypothetical protein